MTNAVQHFGQPWTFGPQAGCIDLGVLALIGIVPNRCQDNWYFYQNFEGTFENGLALPV